MKRLERKVANTKTKEFKKLLYNSNSRQRIEALHHSRSRLDRVVVGFGDCPEIAVELVRQTSFFQHLYSS